MVHFIAQSKNGFYLNKGGLQKESALPACDPYYKEAPSCRTETGVDALDANRNIDMHQPNHKASNPPMFAS